jgi:monoamine oxidase
MGTAVKYLSSVKRRFWIDQDWRPRRHRAESAREAMRQWERGGKTAVDAFYASRISQV